MYTILPVEKTFQNPQIAYQGLSLGTLYLISW